MEVKLDTVMFYVNDLQKIKKFYVKHFNLKIITEDDIWVLFKAGNVNIAFHKMGAEYINKLNESSLSNNNVKLIFEIDIDIQVARNQFIAENIRMREIKTFDDYDFWLCDGLDPEGNVFQLKSKK